MNLERIDEIIAKNITITDQRLYEGVFNAVLEAVSEENEACARCVKKCSEYFTRRKSSQPVAPKQSGRGARHEKPMGRRRFFGAG
jgi:hypothetical protein